MKARVLTVAIIIPISIVLVMLFGTSTDYEMPRVDIDVTITSDGSLEIAETRTFDFHDDFTAVWWQFGTLPRGSTLSINSVAMRTATQTAQEFSPVDFNIKWRDKGSAGPGKYSYDEAENTLYVFFEESNTQADVSINYSISHAVMKYQDCAELYWKFIGKNWSEDSDNVNLRVHLPKANNEKIIPGENVRAWGHGDVSGTVNIEPKTAEVIAKVPSVKKGTWAEIRILIPPQWLNDVALDDTNMRDKPQLNTILAEEQELARKANQLRRSYWFLGGFYLFCIFGAFVIYLFFGREYKPQFREKYWRNVPSARLDPRFGIPYKIHPVLVRVNEHFGDVDDVAFQGTLVNLTYEGYISLLDSPEGFIIERTDKPYPTDPIDRAAMDLLFNTVAAGGDRLHITDMKSFAKDHSQEFLRAYNTWKTTCEVELRNLKLRDEKSQAASSFTKFFSGFFALAAMIALSKLFKDVSIWHFVALSITGILLLFFALATRRRTRAGAELKAYADALKRWLLDFTDIDQSPPTDSRIWGEFMVYAVLFEISDTLIENVETHLPQILQLASVGRTASWMPTPRNRYIAIPRPEADPLDSLSNTMNISVSTAESSESGSGGGFSLGGGGGFGGGGGGGAR